MPHLTASWRVAFSFFVCVFLFMRPILSCADYSMQLVLCMKSCVGQIIKNVFSDTSLVTINITRYIACCEQQHLSDIIVSRLANLELDQLTIYNVSECVKDIIANGGVTVHPAYQDIIPALVSGAVLDNCWNYDDKDINRYYSDMNMVCNARIAIGAYMTELTNMLIAQNTYCLVIASNSDVDVSGITRMAHKNRKLFRSFIDLDYTYGNIRNMQNVYGHAFDTLQIDHVGVHSLRSQLIRNKYKTLQTEVEPENTVYLFNTLGVLGGYEDIKKQRQRQNDDLVCLHDVVFGVYALVECNKILIDIPIGFGIGVGVVKNNNTTRTQEYLSIALQSNISYIAKLYLLIHIMKKLSLQVGIDVERAKLSIDNNVVYNTCMYANFGILYRLCNNMSVGLNIAYQPRKKCTDCNVEKNSLKMECIAKYQVNPKHNVSFGIGAAVGYNRIEFQQST